MKKLREFRVATKFPYSDHWYFSWRIEAESFDLDQYVMGDGMFEADFDPTKPETNIEFVLYEYDEVHYFGKMIAKTDFMTVWEKWMESVKEVF